jgi:predicted SnoaL-like aldol condensation-catalyzing enzyme
MSNPEQNRQIVLDLFDQLSKKNAGAAAAHFHPDVVEHSPPLADGVDATREFLETLTTQSPDLRIEVKRTVAEGDLVFLHLHVKESAEDRGVAVADIFRLEDGKVVEHWDVVQPVPETAANDNGMF